MADLSSWSDDIHVIGTGGIGTHVVLALLEMRAREIHIWDDDYVEAHNLPTQFMYRPEDVGEQKVTAMAAFVRDRGFNTAIITHNERVTASTKLSGIVISGVDDMTNREAIWGALEFNALVPLYVDLRIGGDTLQAHTVDPSDDADIERYTSWLVPEDEAPDLSCITRENQHTGLEVPRVVCGHLALFLKGKPIRGYLEINLLSDSKGDQRALAVTA